MTKVSIHLFKNNVIYDTNSFDKIIKPDEISHDCYIIIIFEPNDIKNPKYLTNLFSLIKLDLINGITNDYKPIIFTTPLKLFDEFIDSIDSAHKLKSISQTYPFTTSIFNPNIWVKFYDWDDLKTNKININNELKLSQNLYNNPSAQEVYEYFIRTQSANYLVSGDHSKHITPKIYTNELQSKQDIIDINDKVKFDNEKPTPESLTFATHPEIAHYNKSGFRILLIDDKAGNSSDTGEIQSDVWQSNQSKACQIAQLMREPNTFNIPNENLVWNINAIKVFIFNKIDSTIAWSIQSINIKDDFGYITQIIQVTNVVDAICLLASDYLKFDLVLMDYLLDKKENNINKRELATNLFLWLKQPEILINSKEKEIRPELIYIADKLAIIDGETSYQNNCKKCIEIVNKHIKNPIKNRGPLHKLWIFPISAFNQTMLDCLSDLSVRRIDYYWHINNGADPTTTPFHFLKELNLFLYLQLEYAVYTLESIHKFIYKHLYSLQILQNERGIDFSDFQAFMGAEYSVFIEFYFNRPVIYRDKDLSLFSKYVWDNFLSTRENKALFAFSQSFQSYLNKGAFGSESDIPIVKKAIHKCNVILENENWFCDHTQNEMRKVLVEISLEINKIMK